MTSTLILKIARTNKIVNKGKWTYEYLKIKYPTLIHHALLFIHINIYNETYHRGYTDDYFWHLKHINVIFMEIWIIAPGVVNMRRYIDFDISCISKMAKITKTYFLNTRSCLKKWPCLIFVFWKLWPMSIENGQMSRSKG